MTSIGSTIRRAFGPYERQVAEAYRRIFIDLDDLAGAIRARLSATPPARILEIGCGEGALAERLVRDWPEARYLGIDIIAHLGRMYAGAEGNVSFRQVTAQDLARQTPGAFDLVVINDVLHHVPEALRPEIVAAARDLLRPGGCLLLKDWARRPTPIHAACYVADRYIGGDATVRYMRLDEQRALIGAAFGAAALVEECTIAPWRHNHAFFVTRSDG